MRDIIIEYPNVSGGVLILIGGALLIYNLKREDGFNFEDFNILDWNTFIGSWVLTVLSFAFGVNLLMS